MKWSTWLHTSSLRWCNLKHTALNLCMNRSRTILKCKTEHKQKAVFKVNVALWRIYFYVNKKNSSVWPVRLVFAQKYCTSTNFLHIKWLKSPLWTHYNNRNMSAATWVSLESVHWGSLAKQHPELLPAACFLHTGPMHTHTEHTPQSYQNTSTCMFFMLLRDVRAVFLLDSLGSSAASPPSACLSLSYALTETEENICVLVALTHTCHRLHTSNQLEALSQRSAWPSYLLCELSES